MIERVRAQEPTPTPTSGGMTTSNRTSDHAAYQAICRGEFLKVRVPLALHNTNPNPLVEGPTLMLAPVHSKVLRAESRKGETR